MKTVFDKDRAIKTIEETASKTVSFTVTMMKIIFILIVVYSIAITLLISYNSGTDFNDFLITMATISVGGFWAFFLGYFGWRMGQTLEVYFYKLRTK